MFSDTFRFRVFFHDGHPPRDVTARTSDGARRTAIYAERVTGHRGRLYVSRVELLFPVGTHTQQRLFREEAWAMHATRYPLFACWAHHPTCPPRLVAVGTREACERARNRVNAMGQDATIQRVGRVTIEDRPAAGHDDTQFEYLRAA